MVKLIVPNDIINDTPADASPVEQNFNRIEAYINTDSIERNGSVAMSAQLKLVGDPVAPLDAAPKQYVDTFLPIGIIMMFGGTGAPPGGKWAECNGAEVESAVYPDLYAIIGSRYSVAGVPAGRFNLPSLGGRVPLGAGTSDQVGKQGGNRDAPIVTHTHPIDHTHAPTSTGYVSNDHTHPVNIWSGGQNQSHYHMEQLGTILADGGDISIRFGDGFTFQARRFDTSGTSTNWAAQDHQHPVNGNTGGISANHLHSVNVPAHNGASSAPAGSVAAADANLPPFLAVTYIMRVA